MAFSNQYTLISEKFNDAYHKPPHLNNNCKLLNKVEKLEIRHYYIPKGNSFFLFILFFQCSIQHSSESKEKTLYSWLPFLSVPVSIFFIVIHNSQMLCIRKERSSCFF